MWKMWEEREGYDWRERAQGTREPLLDGGTQASNPETQVKPGNQKTKEPTKTEQGERVGLDLLSRNMW